MKEKFYSLIPLLRTAPDAKYYMIYGERSNGKTFAVLETILFGQHEKDVNVNGYLDDGSQGAIIRRYEEDFRGKRGVQMFEGFVNNNIKGNIIEKRSHGKWNEIKYEKGCWWLAHVDENGEVDRKDERPFCYRFSITGGEHDKSTSYPNITNILFDEFLTREFYLPDEFVLFVNLLSTIIRLRDNARIFMCGNTVNKYCPYFNDMGLTNIKNQKKGTIDVYTYGNSALKVAVEYSDFPAKKKKSDIYFAFDNPKLKMITSGEWELNLYPHCPMKYDPWNVLFLYFIVFDREVLQCEVVSKEGKNFTFIHRKTTPIKDDGKAIVYQQDYDVRRNYTRNITKPRNKIEQKIYMYFVHDRVFYQDNTVGETVRNYLKWCVNEA